MRNGAIVVIVALGSVKLKLPSKDFFFLKKNVTMFLAWLRTSFQCIGVCLDKIVKF